MSTAAGTAAGRGTGRLEASTYVLGRGEGCDVRLDERNVSRRHAVIGRDEPAGEGGEGGEGADGEGGEGAERGGGGGGWWVEDAGSSNGTYLDGRLVRARTPLRPGACLQVGDAVLTLRDSSGADRGPRRSPRRPGFAPELPSPLPHGRLGTNAPFA
jgi:pSer/pThr/pTyr-binding forkhead associated (FHA) protein